MTTDKQRAVMGEVMDLLVEIRGKVHYRQLRPMETMSIHTLSSLHTHLSGIHGIAMDCSESVTLICHIAGLRDPNGRHYDGQGFTGTLLDDLRHRHTPGRQGSMAVVGHAPGEHVIMRRDEKRWFSHGSEADPRYFTFAEMEAAFPGKHWTFLGIGNLGM